MPSISSEDAMFALQSVSRRRQRTESGVSLFLGIISLLFIIPLVGLSIDVGVLYVVKARLQASVDGASLAAARALVLGSTTAAQSTSAKQNAVNWFYANFPTGNWGTYNTIMDQSTVNVFDDPNNPQVRNVTVSATTTAPTYFMKWLRFNSVVVSTSGNASRRDVVVMMVLDRSGSMSNAGACDDMINAAKVFTGQFSAGRDRIGLVSFSDNVVLHSSPTTNFRTVLGYTNNSGSAAGALDSITCAGGTSTAQAISLAYNELYRTNLPGALNVLMFETDGLPNTLTMNFWDSANTTAGIANTSTCKDANTKTMAAGGFQTPQSLPAWTDGYTLGSGSYFSNIPSGIVGAVSSDDPGGSDAFFLMLKFWRTDTTVNTDYLTTTNSAATGCYFLNSAYHHDASPNDIAWFPTTDVWGNALRPATNRYKSVTLSGGHVQVNWTNYHNAVLNATDNAAYRARTNSTIPAYFFGIGLGGSSANPPDYILMQRMANDSRGDSLHTPPKYDPCDQEPGCITYDNQPQGTFVYSSNASELGQAFLSISSQILRLSK